MTIPLVAAVTLIVGILMYALSGNAKVAEIGRLMFAVSLLVCLLALESWHALSLR